ncbi:MAG TPA: DUF937 domain-containing protein [Pseudorhizobium sp.]|nr:DUF937 domain-containing protein [Pseudorhizobium sp.]
MLPLFEMMLKAQNGAAAEAMARQFHLAQEQAAQAIAALMPAFASGFRRTASDPKDLYALMSAMMSGSYAKYFEDLSKAFTPQGIADGNVALDKIFGSTQVTRAIAAQASQLTGLSQDMLKNMMPIMADMLMGGMFKQATGQMQKEDAPDAGAPFGQMYKQWLENLGLQPKQTAAFNPWDIFDAPFMQSVRQVWGLQDSLSEASAKPFGDNPFVQAFQNMVGCNPGPQAAKDSNGSSNNADAYLDLLGSMFDSGLKVQKTYQKNMEAIFDAYFKKPSSDSTASSSTDKT